jgi:hypothetical protein
MLIIEEADMKIIIRSLAILSLLCAYIPAGAAGNGIVKVGYTIMDEEGNKSVNQGTFNYYPGLAFSLEKFNYNLKNGLRFNADLKNISLNNRGMTFGVNKPGLFGLQMTNHQYRRTYDFDGSSFTRRRQTGGSLWFFPNRHIKLFAGGTLTGMAGNIVDLYNTEGFGSRVNLDYSQKSYNAGLRLNCQGRMFQVEYWATDYTDNINAARDQKRAVIRLDALMPIPNYEQVILSGGFRHFETKFTQTDFVLSSNTVWGGANYNFAKYLTLNYNFIFDRTGSDSDYIATDNIAHTIYAGYNSLGKGGLTVGYQNDINDDFENKVKANSYYLSGWFIPAKYWEIRGEYGNRAEKMEDGWRLTGDEDRTRYKISARFKPLTFGSITIKYENRHRKNDQLLSETDFNRLSADGNLRISGFGDISGGYSYATGDYKNRTSQFKFADHLLFGEINSIELFNHIVVGFGAQYYRSRRDLDIESFMLNLKIKYRFINNHYLEIIYNAHNFDDFIVNDRYYTANIVEINLIKDLSL